jgi:hypothetical protein
MAASQNQFIDSIPGTIMGQELEEWLETNVAKLDLSSFTSRDDIFGFISQAVIRANPRARSLVLNFLAEWLGRQAGIPAFARMGLKAFVLSIAPGLERNLAGNHFTADSLNRQVSSAWNASGQKRELEDPSGACTGDTDDTHVHKANGCHHARTQNSRTGSILDLIRQYRRRRFLCDRCFPEFYPHGELFPDLVDRPDAQAAFGTFFSECPRDKREHFYILVKSLLFYMSYDATSSEPGDQNDEDRLLNAWVRHYDGIAYRTFEGLQFMVQNEPEALIKHLDVAPAKEVLANPRLYVQPLFMTILGVYTPSKLASFQDFLDKVIPIPQLKGWLKARTEGADIGPLLQRVRGPVVGTLKALMTAYLAFWAIVIITLIPSGVIFVFTTLKLLLFEPATFDLALLYLVAHILGIVGILFARFEFPLFDMIHGGVANAIQTVNPLDNESAGGRVVKFATGIMESQGWISKSAAASIRASAQKAKDHPIWLKRGLTISIISLIAGLLVFAKFQFDYGLHMGVMIFALMAAIGLSAEATKLASPKFGSDYIVKFAENVSEMLNKRLVIGMVAATLIAGFAVTVFPSLGAKNNAEQTSEMPATQTEQAQKKATKGDIPEYCFFKNYDPKNGKLPGCP